MNIQGIGMRSTVALVGLWIAGCSGEITGDGADAGPGPGPDAGLDAGRDAGTDTGPEPDAGPDAGRDAGTDTGPAPDAGPDAGPATETDSGTDAGFDAHLPPPPLRITTRLTSRALRGSPYSGEVRSTGGVGATRTWTLLGTPPSWLRIEGSTELAHLVGTPPPSAVNQVGTARVQVVDEAGTMATRNVVFELVNEGGFVEVAIEAPRRTYGGAPYQALVRGLGGEAPYTYAALDASPAELAFSGLDGLFGGVVAPSAVRELPYQLVFHATDSMGRIGLGELVLRIDEAREDTWRVINHGAPLLEADEVINSVTGLRTGDGAFLWMANTFHLGTVMGRLDVHGRWTVMREGAFSEDFGAPPTSVTRSYATIRQAFAFARDDSSGRFVMLSNQGLQHGLTGMDIHGFPSFHRFDGADLSTWGSGAGFDPYVAGPVIYGYSGTGVDGASFAYDPVHDEGLAVGTTGNFLAGFRDQLVAARYEGASATQSFRRWNREWDEGSAGGWHTDNYWSDTNDLEASRRQFVLDPRVDVASVGVRWVRVAHLKGTRNYLVSFSLQPYGSSAPWRSSIAVYDPTRAMPWSYWDGTALRDVADETTGFMDRIADIGSGGESLFPIPLSLPDGDALLVFFDGAEGGIWARRYDAATRTFDARERIFLGREEEGSRVIGGVMPDGTAVVALDGALSGINVRRRHPDGRWGEPETIYRGGNPVPMAIVEHEGEALVLIRDNQRLFAVLDGRAPESAAGARTIRRAAPARVIAPASLVGDSTVPNFADHAEYFASQPGQIGIDDDGYLYATRTDVCSVIVAPPGSTGTSSNHSWGAFFDILAFPTGIAVDAPRNRVYVTSEIIEEGAGGVGKLGALSIWETEPYRDRNLGRRGFSGPLPPTYSPGFWPRLERPGMRYPAGLAIDSDAQLLYATSALTHEIFVFDVSAAVTQAVSLERAFFIFDAEIEAEITNIVDRVVASGLMQAVGGAHVAYAAGQVRFALVEAVIRATPEFAAFSAVRQEELLRKFSQAFFDRALASPLLLLRWGAGVGEAGTLRFPTGVGVDLEGDLYVVDTEHHRVVRLRLNATHTGFTEIASYGSFGGGAGQLLNPTGVTVTNDGRVWVADPHNRRVVVYRGDGGFDFHFTDLYVGDRLVPALTMTVASDASGRLAMGSGTELVFARWLGM